MNILLIKLHWVSEKFSAFEKDYVSEREIFFHREAYF